MVKHVLIIYFYVTPCLLVALSAYLFNVFFLPCWKYILTYSVHKFFIVLVYVSVFQFYHLLIKDFIEASFTSIKLTQPLKLWDYRYIQQHQLYCLPFWWLYSCILYGQCVDLLAEVGIHLSTSHFFFPLVPHLKFTALYYSLLFYHFQINIGLLLEPLVW